MKNYKFLYLLTLILIVACDTDEYAEYTAPDELSDVSWVISLERFAQDPFSLNKDSFMSFMDLSQGAVSHEWIIEEGNYFLEEGFGENDTLENFIDEEAGLSITEAKAHVLFRNTGLNRVRLLNKFTEPVSYKSSQGTFEAVKEGDLWVIDTTFVFDIYANLKPTFSVFQENTQILTVSEDDEPSVDDEASWPVVDVESGKSLTFIDNTNTGRPNARRWRFPNGIPQQSNQDTARVRFYELGTFNAGTITSLRVNPLPRDSVSKPIPLKINVISSSEPFKIAGNIMEAEDETIFFRVTGQVSAFSGEESNFTVNVTNDTSGFSQTIAVQQAKVSTTDETIIELVLAEPIYNSDNITVSYNGEGNIQSIDTRSLEAFERQPVQMYFGGNILPDNGHSDFEVSHPQAKRAYAADYFVGNANLRFGEDNLIWQRVETSDVDPSRIYNGSASMRYQTPASDPTPNSNLFSFGLGKPDPIPAGTYIMSYWIYIESGTTLRQFTTTFGNPITDSFDWNIEDLSTNEWVKITNVVTLPRIESPYRMGLRFDPGGNSGVSGDQLIYFDNWELVELEIRP